MKTYNKPAVSKLVVRFDNELRDILANDLNEFLNKNPFLKRKRQANMQSTLSVAWPSIYTSTYKFLYITYENDRALQLQGSIFLLHIL